MYLVLSIAVACAISVANYIYLPAGQRIPEDEHTDDYLETYYSTNDTVLKQLFPYEEVNYALTVPSNMSYTTADFQRFEGTYLTEREPVDGSYLKHICFCGDSITYHMTIKNRLLITIPLLGAGAVLTQLDFNVLWRYFSWSNQTLAMISLWVATAYLIKNTRHSLFSLMTAIPGSFMSAVSLTYILMAKEGFKLSSSIAYPAGIIFATVLFCFYLFKLSQSKKSAS